MPMLCVFVDGVYVQSYGPDLHEISAKITSLDSDSYHSILTLSTSINYVQILQSFEGFGGGVELFVSGDRSSVGKTSACLSILAALIRNGLNPAQMAYIKPVTQCEAEQPIQRFCERMGIDNQCIGPVVFYQGFTRAYLQNATDHATVLVSKAVDAVRSIGKNKKFVLVDGVGYPSVGSICGVSNADVAKALNIPVLLIGKSGVGDAIDSYNLNSAYFEIQNIVVMGGIFNKIPTTGYYSLAACNESVTSYFQQYRPMQLPYGFVPIVSTDDESIVVNNKNKSEMEVDDGNNGDNDFEDRLISNFIHHVDIQRLIHDAWIHNLLLRGKQQAAVTIEEAIRRLQLSRNIDNLIVNNVVRSSLASDHKLTRLAEISHNYNNTKQNSSNNVTVSTNVIVSGSVEGRSKRTRSEIELEAKNKGAKGG